MHDIKYIYKVPSIFELLFIWLMIRYLFILIKKKLVIVSILTKYLINLLNIHTVIY